VLAAPLEDGLADLKVGAAATVNPEAATVETPGAVADAGGAADLARKTNIASGADVTPVSVSIVGGAGDNSWRRNWCGDADDELGAATAVDPEATIVEAPGASLDANSAADLAC
jgi:hypothetical protein